MLTKIVAGCVPLALALGCGPTTELPQNPRIAAHVGDHRITEADLNAAWREREPAEYARARQNIYRMRRAVLDDLIADVLVADEVARENRPEAELVTLAVESGAVAAPPAVDETEIAALYEQSGAAEYGIRLGTLRSEFAHVLEEQRTADTRDRYRDYLRANEDVRVLLDPPRTIIPLTASDPIRGVSDAPITVVEFSDFHCPFCRRMRPILEQLLQKYADHVRWVWKHYPLGSTAAALAATCAHDQGRFWDYHDALFHRQEDIAPADPDGLQVLAAEVGLNEDRFAVCVTESHHEEDIELDAATGRAAGVTGTPTLFVNGKMVAGVRSFETYEAIILDELQLAGNRN